MEKSIINKMRQIVKNESENVIGKFTHICPLPSTLK